jgi:hypothetical protein
MDILIDIGDTNYLKISLESMESICNFIIIDFAQVKIIICVNVISLGIINCAKMSDDIYNMKYFLEI